MKQDFVQQKLVVITTQELEKLLKTKVSISNIEFVLPNRIVLDSVVVYDREQKPLLFVEQLSASIELKSLLDNKFYINYLSLISPQISFYKKSLQEPLNAQFIFDELATKDTVSEPSRIELKVNQLLITRGKVSYNVHSEPKSPNQFNINHQCYNHLHTNISIKTISNDSVNIYIRKLAFNEESGFKLKKLTFKATANSEQCRFENFLMVLPNTQIPINRLSFSYKGSTPEQLLSTVQYDGKFNNVHLTLSDMACFFPQFKNFNDELLVGGIVKGNRSDIQIENAYFHSKNQSIAFSTNLSAKNIANDAPVAFSAKGFKLKIAKEGMDFLSKNLSNSTLQIPAQLMQLGQSVLEGDFTLENHSMTAIGKMQGDAGNIDLNFFLAEDGKYEGSLLAENLSLDNFFQDKGLGNCNFGVHLNGYWHDKYLYDGTISGDVASLEYKGYTYQGGSFKSKFDEKNTMCQITIDDPNCTVNLSAQYAASPLPKFECIINIDSIFPNELHLTANNVDAKISLQADIKTKGNNIDNLIVNGSVSNFRINSTDYNYSFRKMMITADSDRETGKKSFIISSDFLDCSLTGYYSYNTLPYSFLAVVQRYLPNIVSDSSFITPQNYLVFNINTDNSELFTKAFRLPIEVRKNLSINGSINDIYGKYNVNGQFNDVLYDESQYKSIGFTIDSDNDELNGTLSTVKFLPFDEDIENSVDDEMLIVATLTGKDNKLSSSIKWNNNYAPFYNGKINIESSFNKKNNHRFVTTAKVAFDELVINNLQWGVDTFSLTFDDNEIDIDQFFAQSDDKYMDISGCIGKDEQDSLIVKMQNIDLKYLFDIVSFHPVSLEGLSTGAIYLNHLLAQPAVDAKLFVKDFLFEHGLIGDLELTGKWNQKGKAIELYGDIHDGDNSSTIVSGFVSPANDTLNIAIKAHNTRVDFLNHLIGSILCDVDGSANGQINVLGKMRHINLSGALAANTRLKIKPLKAPYTIEGDTIWFNYNEIEFKEFKIHDEHGNFGFLNGGVHHHCLKRFSCDFDIETNNLLIFHTPDFGNDSFYGTVFATGNANIEGGGGRGLRVKANVTTGDNSLFVYNAGTPESITSNEFITFIDAKKKKESSTSIHNEIVQTEEIQSSVNIDFLANITTGMDIKVIMNPITGDYINARGSGMINAVYDEKDGFTMKGNLDLNSGMYKFTLQDIFPKEFVIQPGSTIAFNGDPFLANLNLQTIYTVNSASLNDLSADATQKNTVKVNCLMDISNTLENPSLKFGLELPDGNEEEKELLLSATNTDEQLNMQFIYLLGIGKFYTYDYNNSGSTASTSAVESLISSSISGQLNNMLSQIIDNDNWNLAGNFTTNERGWNSMEIEGMLSGKLLNNRLLINGNFGYRDNPIANSNFIGDFEIQWLLNRSGTISLKGYNKTNDRYFSKTTLNTQGAGILFKKDFDGFNPFKKNYKE